MKNLEPIKIIVKCFSHVKYALGKDEISLEIKKSTTTIELEKIIREKANGQLDGIPLRIALNKQYVKEELQLNDGDEVALIPPVQGG